MQVALGQFQEASALFREALMDNPDDWTSLQQFLDCTFAHRGDSGDHPLVAADPDDPSTGLTHLMLHEGQQVCWVLDWLILLRKHNRGSFARLAAVHL